ncbi:unnamed protein product, partial [Ectocarpus sp. 12 AP-2014]
PLIEGKPNLSRCILGRFGNPGRENRETYTTRQWIHTYIRETPRRTREVKRASHRPRIAHHSCPRSPGGCLHLVVSATFRESSQSLSMLAIHIYLRLHIIRPNMLTRSQGRPEKG